MPSKFLDPEQLKKLAEHRYDFGRKTLGGKVVLVPGGMGGLGGAVTAMLLSEGTLAVVGYRSQRGRALAFQQKLQDLYGGPVTLVEGDVADPAVREKYLKAALDVKGEIYGLVALAGNPAGEVPILLARAAAEAMLRKGTKGAIVLFSSIPGEAALVHAARSMAREYGGASDIRVNVVAPGVTIAGMERAAIDSGKYDRYVEHGAIPRFGRPEDIAKVVRLLLEPDSYITGQAITVDGGLTLRRGRLT